jgi:hypothetical protein
LQPRQLSPFHDISRYVCVCVCVCVRVVRVGVPSCDVRRRHAIEQKSCNSIGLSALSLMGSFERGKISLDVVLASLKQSCSKCSHIARESLYPVLVWRRYTIWSYFIVLHFADVVF